MTIHVTETQKFLVRSALEVSGADERLTDPKLIEDMIRAMLVIEQGRMQAYMLRGFNWSCISRNSREPLAVSQDKDELERSVDWFHEHIDHAREEPARRIRGNRKRRIRKLFLDAQHLQRYAGQQLRELEQRRRGVFNPDAVNWYGVPRQLPVGYLDEDAA